MDASDFVVRFDIVGSNLMTIIEDQLLQGKTDNRCIRAEPVRLNIYGKYCPDVSPISPYLKLMHPTPDNDSFFEVHRGIPHDADMYGSLVVIYPTPYEGGELVLRHKGHEWKIDAKVLTAPQTSPSLAYVAFCSEVEHEVLKVTTGHRVMVTYDLYLVDPSWKQAGAPAVTRNTEYASNFQGTLQELLKSPEFLPGGGTLGFGLANLYPFTFKTNLQEMESHLKGRDAHVYRTCREFKLQPSLRVIYDSSMCSNDGIMLDEIVKNIRFDYGSDSYRSALDGMGGVTVNKDEDPDPEYTEYDEYVEDFITWISPLNDLNELEATSIAYEKQEISVCFNPCIIVRIAAACDRVD